MSAIPSSVEDAAADRAFAALLADVRAIVDPGLVEWLRPRTAVAASLSADVGAVAASVADLTLRGGKRLRAAILAGGFRAFSDAPLATCAPAMIAIELLQTYLLIHDDWMDGDDRRRGGPSVHVELAEKLGSRTLGDAAAILAGDLACGYAQEALLESCQPPERVLRAARAFARIQVEVVTGQMADMRAASAAGRAGSPGVETILALKTASYTVTGPLLLGAALAGADDARSAELERFGRPLGVAFQLRDDLLGVFGDASALGKPVGNDIREGKETALVAELRRDPRADAVLSRTLGNRAATPDEVGEVVRMMVDSGARARVETRFRELSDEARRTLEAIGPSIAPLGYAQLRGAVRAIGERSS